jgi:hypothetical protein
MPYREDLDAALAHAHAAERALEEARKESEADHARIAELEAQLTAAKRGVERKREREPKEPMSSREHDSGTPFNEKRVVVFSISLTVLLVGGGILGVNLMMTRGEKSVVDISRDILDAEREAHKTLPDPVLSAINADLVDPKGIADLTQYPGRVSYVFVSPSRSAVAAPIPTGPIGAPAPQVKYDDCAVSIRYEKNRLKTYTTQGRGAVSCGEPLPGPPHCSVADVWAEAIYRGAPQNALASLRLAMRDVRLSNEKSSRHMAAWRFSIAGTVIDYTIPDACPFPTGRPPLL